MSALLYTDIFVGPKDLEKVFDKFHLSVRWLGSTFTFTPRVPKYMMQDNDGLEIEDDFTPRISLCDSIKNCLKAVPKREFKDYMVYAGKGLPVHRIEDNIPKCPKVPPRKYGTDFTLSRWIDWLGTQPISEKQRDEYQTLSDRKEQGKIQGPKDLPPKFRNRFTGCVPDANETHELWATEPIKLTCVGHMEPEGIRLTVEGARALKLKTTNLNTKPTLI